ncbi:phosphohydrolase [Philodulcilactobacillus myokoensis]|uniref:Phosphohydrolase n=1 Tax=Philodulcilactobacillus myokoensis TaxID=2929573 RepID=A0A9W6B1H3_9LACO|nr:HD domain-containing protein [Philodulcilactobacillus myokoensis]GLB47224.1 phosphohydrolase [Philodulcilactobacillus myokoensis]
MKYADKLLPREKVFRDPVHNYIYVQNQVIADLIDTPEFQRLRRVKQLGTTSFTFHGAEHSRFGHCLGVYEITRRICNNFQKNYPTKKAGDGLWDQSDRLVALCAALLHDIGHGAYSHTFEHIFKTDHEAITREIITSNQTAVNHILKQVSPDFPEKVASVIKKTYQNPQVVQMISSQCDADRMDYLLRDSYYTGTNYGDFDLNRILRIMRPYKNGICFESNGMHSVEDYIIGRFQMYQQVYFHPVSRSMECVLDRLLARAKHLYQHHPKTNGLHADLLEPFFNHQFNLEDYLELDDGVLNTYFISWKHHAKDKILRDLAHRFIDRRPFASVKYNQQTKSEIPKMRKLIKAAGFDTNYYTTTNNSFDLPYDIYYPNKKNVSGINLKRPDGSLVELSTVSSLVNAITDKLQGDQRFFFPKEMLECGDKVEIFQPLYQKFQQHIKNNTIIKKRG